MTSPYWVKTLINKTFGTRFAAARLTRHPAIERFVDAALFDQDDIFYLPRDSAIAVNRPLDAPQSLAAPSAVVDHFIEAAGSRWIMDFCICRQSSGCRDYPHDLGCIFLGEAARGIHPRFGRLAGREETLAHAQRCREAGLVHLVGRNKLDTVWLNVGPGGNLLTICNCCPCCCLWRVLPDLAPSIGNKVSGMPGVAVRVTDRCTGCGACTRGVCFVDAIAMQGDHAFIDQNRCRHCGRCAEACAHTAIDVVIEDSAYIDSAIRRLRRAVDVASTTVG